MAVPPVDDGRSPAPIDRAILEVLAARLETTAQVDTAAITDASGRLELRVTLSETYYPDRVGEAWLSVCRYRNDDFVIHYREDSGGGVWECRWDRHPNPHNSRDHFHPPPDAATPGEDASWPTDHREVVSLVLNGVEERVGDLWAG